jgi:D-alanyl-D-alanine carboxypeptidase/D-alanyl-D-alanine-endopeptidase (penicillin-binding protein 4)
LTINDNTLVASIKPGIRVGEPCRLALLPATAWLIFSNRTETTAKGSRRDVRLYRPVGENVIFVSGEMPLDDAGSTEDVTFCHPAGLFVSFLKTALARANVEVGGQTRAVNWLDRQANPLQIDKLVELGSVESPPMSDLAREIEKPSQNLYTDLLLAHVGEKFRTASADRETSEDLGVRELNKFLGEAGIKRGEVLFEEGSGLSRDNLTTPEATVALLRFMNRHVCSQAYHDALPIAGVDGTLRNRMKGTPAAGNLRGKTGSLRWAASLSGYVTTAAGEHLAFSLMLNRYHNAGPGHSARDDLDAIAIQLASFTGRSEP